MYDEQHDDDMDVVAKWLTPDLHPNEYGDESFISRMAYKYRDIIDRYIQNKIDIDHNIICQCLYDAYDKTRKGSLI